jgi:hypothetical protein
MVSRLITRNANDGSRISKANATDNKNALLALEIIPKPLLTPSKRSNPPIQTKQHGQKQPQQWNTISTFILPIPPFAGSNPRAADCRQEAALKTSGWNDRRISLPLTRAGAK